MAKRILEDIKLNSHKVVREYKEDVVVKSKHISSSPIDNIYHQEDKYEFLEKKKQVSPVYTQRIPQTPHMPGKGKAFNKSILWIFILALLVGGYYLFSTVFFKAKVTVIPKSKVFELKGDSFTSSKKNNIPFEVMIVEDTLNKDVVLTSSKEVTNKAKGEVTLYNKYAKTTQKLIAGSFITDEYGKSYKIDTTVSIPGYTVDKAAKLVPGQINVGITSFIAGEAYNGSPKLFSITLYKNTDKYSKIYGELKTPLSGGVAGLVYVVDDNEKALILSNVSSSEDRLLRKLKALVPDGYILFPNTVDFSYDLGESLLSKIPNTKIDVKGTLKAVIMKKADLSSYLISKLLPDISNKERSEILDPDLSVLTFNFVNKDQIITKEMDNFDFNLVGNITLDWSPNISEIKQLMIGKNKDELPSIFKTDPAISNASVQIIPFWSEKLPDVGEKISIIIKK